MDESIQVKFLRNTLKDHDFSDKYPIDIVLALDNVCNVYKVVVDVDDFNTRKLNFTFLTRRKLSYLLTEVLYFQKECPVDVSV